MTVRRRFAALLSSGILLVLLPSFIADAIQPERRRKPSKLHPTSYLDGLRGLAACSVFAYHYTDYNHKFFLPAYGSNPPDQGSSILQLPYIRIVYAGTPMVHIFFVISGFALAYRPLKCLYEQRSPASPSHPHSPRSGAIAKCHAVLASSAFRRPIRLFGPPLVLTLTDVILVRLGFMNNFIHPEPSLWAQMTKWAEDAVANLTWPWGWDDRSPHSKYNPHLWTIPIEFTHSMLLFLVLLAISRLRSPALRQTVLALCMAYMFLLCGRWASFEFLAGALLADFHISKESTQTVDHHDGSQGHGGKSPKDGISFFVERVAPLIVLAAAGYIISLPSRPGDITPSYVWLMLHVPSQYAPDRAHAFWYALAAFGIVWACARVLAIRRVLESGPAQYAGRISFAFYILQHPILNICEHHVLGAAWKAAKDDKPEVLPWGVRGLTGQSTPTQRTVCWFIGLCILGGMLVWAADVFTRLVDTPIVKAARSLEGMAFARDDEDGEVLPMKN